MANSGLQNIHLDIHTMVVLKELKPSINLSESFSHDDIFANKP